MIVVFDAAAQTAPSEPSPHPMLSLRFSTPPANADATVLDLLTRSEAAKSGAVIVVTADRDLSWEARKRGARVLAPESWEPLRAPKGRKEKSAPKEEKPRASAKDVDYWLGVFGEDGDDE